MIKMYWISCDRWTFRGRFGLLALIILTAVLSTVYLYPYLVIEKVLQPAAIRNLVENQFKQEQEQSETTGITLACQPEGMSKGEIYESSLVARVKNARIGKNSVCPTGTEADRERILQKMMKTADLKNWPRFVTNFRSPCFFIKEGPKCLPYLYVAGVAKSGTSTLFRHLLKHQHILEPAMREEAFYSIPGANLWDLIKNFKLASSAAYLYKDESGCHRKLIAAANPLMFTNNVNTWPTERGIDMEPNCSLAHTLYAMVPQSRIIMTLREPVMRLLSEFRQTTTGLPAYSPRGIHSPELFHKNVLHAINIMQTCLDKRTLRSCIFDTTINKKFRELHVYLHYGMYYPFAVEWLSAFPVTQIHFIKAQELYENAGEVMTDVFRFLQLDTPAAVLADIQATATKDHDRVVESERQNTSFHNVLWDSTRKALHDFYEPYNRQLATLLDDDKWLFRTSV